MNTTSRTVLDSLGWGCVLLAMVQLPGALFDSMLRRQIAVPLIIVIVLFAVAAPLLWPFSRRTRPRGWRLIGAAAVAFAIAAALAQAAPMRLAREVTEVDDIGILVPAARRTTECRGQPRRCHEQVINELGFRGAMPQRAQTADALLVAFVGDSHIFGAGVGEQDTVPAVVGRELADMPSVTVVNAGIEGINGGNFPGVIRYLRSRLRPDVIVVLLKDDDLDQQDKFTRWALFRHSFWFRMLSVTNIEPIYETARQAARVWFGQDNAPDLLNRLLDSIAAAAGETKLIVVAAFSDDLQPTFQAWMATHREVAQTSSWQHPEYWSADKIPYDGHWTEAGCRTIAGIVTPLLRTELGSARAGRRNSLTAEAGRGALSN